MAKLFVYQYQSVSEQNEYQMAQKMLPTLTLGEIFQGVLSSVQVSSSQAVWWGVFRVQSILLLLSETRRHMPLTADISRDGEEECLLFFWWYNPPSFLSTSIPSTWTSAEWSTMKSMTFISSIGGVYRGSKGMIVAQSHTGWMQSFPYIRFSRCPAALNKHLQYAPAKNLILIPSLFLDHKFSDCGQGCCHGFCLRLQLWNNINGQKSLQMHITQGTTHQNLLSFNMFQNWQDNIDGNTTWFEP